MQWPANSCGTVFLTGATGVFGSHLLKELLQTTDVDVYCLVRASTEAEARARLHAFLRVYDPDDTLADEFFARVKPVLGDVVQPQLGLSDLAFAALAECIDVTIHGAALTNLFARANRIEPVNVGGTLNIIDFVLKTRARSLLYVSTYTVMGDKTFDSGLVFKESDFDIGQGFDHMSYQRSKFLAETAVRDATGRGLLWKIIRPGQIYGESRTGYYPQGQTNVSGLFYDIFKTIIETGVALYSDVYYDVTPVDYVSKATAFLALHEPTVYATYHLTNPDERTYTEITRMLRELGFPIDIVSQEEYKRLLFSRQLLVGGSEYKSYTTQAFKWWYKREGFDFKASCRVGTALTTAVLDPLGIRCPKIDLDLLATYVEHGIKLNYFPAAPTRMWVASR